MKFIHQLLILFLILSCSSSKVKSYKQISGKDHFKKPISVDVIAKKYTAVVFLSSVCPCSGSHIKLLKQTSSSIDNVQFVAIHSNFYEDLNSAQYYFTKAKLGFPVIFDKETELAKSFGAISTPHLFLLNQEGTIEYSGALTSSNNASKAKDNYLVNALKALQGGKRISPKFRKPYGCKIVTK
jgi:thioredoxin-related protein